MGLVPIEFSIRLDDTVFKESRDGIDKTGSADPCWLGSANGRDVNLPGGDGYPLNRPFHRPHATLGSSSLEGRSCRGATTDKPILVSQDDFSVRSNIQQH